MAADDRSALIYHLVDQLFNHGNVDVADELYAPTYLLNGVETSVEDLKEAIKTIHATIPGFRVTAGELRTGGDLVAVAWTIHSQHAQGILGTGRTGLHLFRIEHARVVQEWINRAALQYLEEIDPLDLPF